MGKQESERERSEREDARILRAARKLARRYRIEDGSAFRLKHVKPGDTAGLDQGDRDDAEKALAEGVALLSRLQERLWAQDRWAVLFVFQAMDAAGKDGAIKHVLSGVNPQGCQVVSFKVP